MQCSLSQSVSPQILVKTGVIANLERIIEHVNSVPQKFDRRQQLYVSRNLYTANWTGSIQDPSRMQWIYWTGSRFGILDPLDRIWAEIRSGPSSVYSDLGLIPKDATARGWNIDYGLPDVFDDWCCAVSPRELDFTKFPIVGNGGLFRPSTIAPTPFSALRRRCMGSTDVVYDIPVTT
jgi:hypothetical protein